MDERDQARADIETHRQAIRTIENDLRKRLAEKKKLEPSGLFAMFGSSPDPQRIAELTMEIDILKQELAHRRHELNRAQEAIERMERDQATDALVPATVTDEHAAARMLQAYARLEHLLSEIRTIAVTASQARQAQWRLQRHLLRDRHDIVELMRESRMTAAVAENTTQWEPLIDQAEILADMVGYPLVLPRRFTSSERPDHAPRPDAGVQAARRAATVPDHAKLGNALELVIPTIQQAQTHCILARNALRERFPGASALSVSFQGQPLLDFVQSDPSGSPELDPAEARHQLGEHWQQLRKLYGQLSALAAQQAGTMKLLEPMGHWQRVAAEVRGLDIARELDLMPPINQGADLATFIARLGAEWPALDARFAELEG